ncbi:uncharacterized protein LOC131378721 [Hirundo rustica]|uniref:uncharacterized protein LOC131378721 n=1 Tax=Hirundo rustica TaxID=43150 RepID=UPI002673DC49|nr:uncharacterized protein LOC131378721 [Hirundo rustica]
MPHHPSPLSPSDPQRFHLAAALQLPARPRPPALLPDGFLPCPHPAELLPGPAAALGARGGTAVVPNGDWSQQLLVLLETSPRRGVTSSCQVEHVSLEQPLSRHWGTGEALGGNWERHWDVLGGTGRKLERAWFQLGEGIRCLEGLRRSLEDAGEGREGIGRRFQGVLGGLRETGRKLGGAWGVCERFWGALSPADPPEMLLDAAHSKMLMGIGGFVLGFVFLALGLSFYLCKKVRGGPGGRVPPPPERVCSPRAPQPGVTPFSLPTELLSWQRSQPLPVASGLAGTPCSVPEMILGGSCVPPALLSLCPHPAAPSVPNKASQFTPVLFTGGSGEGLGGTLQGDHDSGGDRTGPRMDREWGPPCVPPVSPCSGDSLGGT